MATLRGVCHSGERLEQLDGGGKSDPLADALFELSDLELEAVEGIDLLGDTSSRLRGKPAEGRLEPSPARAGEDVAMLRAGDAVLPGTARQGRCGQGSVDAVLQGGPELGEGHPGAMEFPLVPNLPWREPDGG